MPLDLEALKKGMGYDWPSVFSEAATRDNVHIDPKDITKVIASIDGDNESPPWEAVVELKDGRVAWVSAWCDYSGWGCQAGGSIIFADSLEKLFNPYWLPREIREDFAPILEAATGFKVNLKV